MPAATAAEVPTMEPLCQLLSNPGRKSMYLPKAMIECHCELIVCKFGPMEEGRLIMDSHKYISIINSDTEAQDNSTSSVSVPRLQLERFIPRSDNPVVLGLDT